MTILITTPRGKVGSELVPLLVEARVPIRLAAHSVEATKARFPGLDIVPFSHLDPKTWSAALSGIDTVYLASPGDSAPGPEQAFIDEAKKSGVKKIVKLSAKGVEHGDSPLRQVEKHLEASGLAYTLIRPTWFHQNYANQSAAAIKAGRLAEPAGTGKTAFIDTRDIAAVTAAALVGKEHDGKAYALTGPEALDRHEVAAILTKELGRTVTYQPLTDEEFRAAARDFLSPAYLELLSALYGFVRSGATAEVTEDVQKVLHRKPIGFAEFAHRARAAWT
jgi:uncharacterized protein YbjT (DUF2867 family)